MDKQGKARETKPLSVEQILLFGQGSSVNDFLFKFLQWCDMKNLTYPQR